jgi:hypothetical protein
LINNSSSLCCSLFFSLWRRLSTEEEASVKEVAKEVEPTEEAVDETKAEEPADVEAQAVQAFKTEDELAEEEWEKAAKESEQAAVTEKKRKEAEKKHTTEKEETKKETTSEADDDADADAHEEMHPHRRKIHKLFFFISVVAMVAALSMATGQIVGLVFQKLGPVQWVLRGYVIALCFLVLFTELEMTKLARENIILHNWICRGLLYSFIGVLGLEGNDTSVFKDDPPLGAGSAKFFMHAVSWIILGKSIVSKSPPERVVRNRAGILMNLFNNQASEPFTFSWAYCASNANMNLSEWNTRRKVLRPYSPNEISVTNDATRSVSGDSSRSMASRTPRKTRPRVMCSN